MSRKGRLSFLFYLNHNWKEANTVISKESTNNCLPLPLLAELKGTFEVIVIVDTGIYCSSPLRG